MADMLKVLAFLNSRLMIAIGNVKGSLLENELHLDCKKEHLDTHICVITMTCNPKWPEIERQIAKHGLSTYERPDIACRVFRAKLDQLMADFSKGELFGKTMAATYTIEFQKRGLSHAHILLWLHPAYKLNSIAMIDSVICTELPNPEMYPNLFNVVSNFMVHGPCGSSNNQSPCMKNDKCSIFFPKKFTNSTSFDRDGFPINRRRNTGVTTTRRDIPLHNGFVVPYNPKFLMKYQDHINIEYCNKENSIKYLFKYINKGVDRVTMAMSLPKDGIEVDEIKQYYDCRYLSPCEAVWRIFNFFIHDQWSSVNNLTFHLPKKQSVIFYNDQNINDVYDRSKEKITMSMAWMEANAKYPTAKDLTYADFPSLFVFDEIKCEWRPRKKGFSIGRMNFVPPGTRELFYMRMLLNVQQGCNNFDELRTMKNELYDTFRDACAAAGLLNDDNGFIESIKETSLLGSDLRIDDQRLRELCLMEIEKILLINGKSLKDFDGMSVVNADLLA
ncbi:uncharacterized protein LOC130725351 [Lotus japonicus]|uniref:uncharacterized protein LOC130725351 n=1 Tax=Lotus japonicus TaxID=34305 RepID=UPI00258A6842|nr:uncharacterized protein LOC130725351 [Lotus japonicus]